MRVSSWVQRAAAAAVLLFAPFTAGAQEIAEIRLGPPPVGSPATLDAAPVAPTSNRVFAPLTVNTADRAAVTALYNDVYLPAQAVPPQWTGSVAGCNAGSTSVAFADATMAAVNFFRAMAGLPAEIVRNPTKDASAQAAALMMTANNNLSHFPPTSWTCYTAQGAEGAGQSNIALGAAGASAIHAYIADGGDNNRAVGHRRWILYPRQTEMGTGSTSNANALWVIGAFGARPSSPAFVAWPSSGYVPNPLIHRRWSFSVNTSSTVDFSSTVVTMTRNGVPVQPIMLAEQKGYGDDTLVWEPVTPLPPLSGTPDETFSVRLNNVIVGGVARSYTYNVIAFDPALSETTDTDTDGLSDLWETTFGLNPQSAVGHDGASGDPDGDGRTNLQEKQAGTHPRGFVTRYLAEGATGTFFDTTLALLNPGATPASVLLRLLKDDGATATHHIPVPPGARRSVRPATLAGLTSANFSTVVESDVLVVVDRTMTWGSGYGSHAETALTSPATTWYLAEGSTSGGFNLFYLLQNPNPTPVQSTVRYLRPFGQAPVEKTYSLRPNSRTTIYVNQQGAELAGTDVSAVITADGPIIAERAMYADRSGQPFAAGHESAGVTSPALEWFLAEGATGPFFDEFVLIANPNATPAQITAEYLLLGGGVLTKTYTVPANGRFSIYVDNEEIPAGSGQRPLANVAVSTTIRSTNNMPVIVERAMWWLGPEMTPNFWYEAHNSPGATTTGTRWALAEGEVGGPTGLETYVLIANTSAADGSAKVTLHFEDGTTTERTYGLKAHSRTNVPAGSDFPTAAGRKFGVVVESLGTIPAQVVVERAMYSSAGGLVWSAGTNALATRLAP